MYESQIIIMIISFLSKERCLFNYAKRFHSTVVVHADRLEYARCCGFAVVLTGPFAPQWPGPPAQRLLLRPLRGHRAAAEGEGPAAGR